MYKALLITVFIGLQATLAWGAPTDDCFNLVNIIIKKEDPASLLRTDWSKKKKEQFIKDIREMGFDRKSIESIVLSLNIQKDFVSPERAKSYLNYVLNLTEKEQAIAISDIAQLDAYEMNSKYVRKFLGHEEKINEHFSSGKMTPKEMDRYEELYYGCRAFRPNEVNKNASAQFKRFNLSLSLGTLAASYAFYNMDKDINAEWFMKLGYDVGITVLFSYVGSHIQGKASDTQLVKSLKSYFTGRALGVTDLIIYDPIFNKEREEAQVRYEKLKQDPEFKKHVDELLKEYKERSLYREYKAKVIAHLKNVPFHLGLGVKGPSVDENGVDWNNLTQKDLDRPEVQEILVLASMAQIYHESKGQWIDTGDKGMDRYAFNTGFYAAQIPKSIVQNYITYQILCMGQDNTALSFTKAVLFNVGMNFVVNQVLFGYREKAINQ